VRISLCETQHTYRVMSGLVLASVFFVSTASIPIGPAEESTDLIVVQIPAQPDRTPPVATMSLGLADWYVDGARIVRLPSSGGDPVVLTPEFHAACDPDVSPDGNTIVFSGKRTVSDTWQIWTMETDGSNKVQLTSNGGLSVAPVFAGSRFYLNDPAPTPQIIYSGTSHGTTDPVSEAPSFALYATDLRGETVRRLTFNLSSDFAPDVLPNGRIVFASWQHQPALEPNGHSALLAVNLDGTDLLPFYGNHETPSFKGLVHVSRFDDRVYFVQTDDPERLGGGEIGEVSLRRPLHSYRKLTNDSEGEYTSPVSLPGGAALASYRPERPGSRFELYNIDPASGRRLERVFGQDGWHTIDAQVLTATTQLKGRSNWLIPGSTTGVFYCLDSYRSNLYEGRQLPPGSVKHVRVIEGVPLVDGALRSIGPIDSTWTEAQGYSPPQLVRRLLGIAPVEEDGSFHIRVPAETPMTFQLLDENYVALREQRAWTWVMGNENRGCIGCHEDRELSPPNRVVDAVLKQAVELTLPPARRRTVDFVNQVSPILETRCATDGCHVAGAAAPDLDVSGASAQGPAGYAAYRSLLTRQSESVNSPYVIRGKARNSPLIWSLYGRSMGEGEQPDTRVVLQMPPDGPLSLRERLLLTEWVDLGAVWETQATGLAGSGR